MAAPVPYTAVLDGQFRLARQRVERGEDVPIILVVIGSTQTRIEVVPFMAGDDEREHWYYRKGIDAFKMSLGPRAALIVRDGPTSEPSLFGQARGVTITYRDGDGLARSQLLPYTSHDAAIDWQPIRTIDHDDYSPYLEQFWNGYRLEQRSATDSRSRTHRAPSWRFRK